MSSFLKETISEKHFELLIDAKIFSTDIIIKAAYNFLDKGYFYFRYNDENNIILEFTQKEGIQEKSEKIIGDFSDELLAVYLRNRLESENRIMRETIIQKALLGPIDSTNYISLDTQVQNEVDIDKDIDEILKEIKSDPDLEINEQEIEDILKEIDEGFQIEKPEIHANKMALGDAKEMFKKKK